MEVSIRTVSVCLLGCNFKFTGTLIQYSYVLLLDRCISHSHHKIRNKKYKEVLAFLAFNIFRSSFEAIKRDKSLTTYTSI